MRDVNKVIRDAYFTALSLTGEKVYYMQAPDDLKGNYIVFQPTSSAPQLMKTGSTVIINMQVIVYTEGNKYNSGDTCDTIANKVYQVLYPNPSFKLDLDPAFQMWSTELQSDTTNSWTLKNQVVAIDRTILFQHKIFIRDTVSQSGGVQWAFVSSVPADISTVTFTDTLPFVSTAAIIVQIPDTASNKTLVLRYPVTGANYTTWFNTTLNNGTLPDSVFNTIQTIGQWKYITTRSGATFNNDQTLIFAT